MLTNLFYNKGKSSVLFVRGKFENRRFSFYNLAEPEHTGDKLNFD
jgi:hypothetical protein